MVTVRCRLCDRPFRGESMAKAYDKVAKHWKKEHGYIPRLTNPLYQDFHGNPPANVRAVKIKVPKKGERLVKLGRLTAVQYRPEPPSKHTGKEYIHQLGDTGYAVLPDTPILACDKSGKNFYIINDKARPKLTSRGIVG